MRKCRLPLVIAALVAVHAQTARADDAFAKIKTVVVIYAENRSFDHLYGLFPGANGIANATAEAKLQLDHDGNPLPHLPPVYDGGKPSPKFPQALPNGPFRIDAPPARPCSSAIRGRPARCIARRHRLRRSTTRFQ